MAQLDNRFIAFWMNTTTAPGTPLTGLSATITIREADSPYTVVVNNQPMTEMGGGHYIYVFSSMSIDKEYSYICNPNATAFIESGVTQNTLYKWIEANRASVGGFAINYGAINGHVTKKFNELDEKVMKELELLKGNDKEIYNKVNETDSHIELAKDDVISTIESQETDDTEIIKSLGIIKSNLTKLSQFVRNEAQKEKEMEKEGMKTEYESKISELVDKIEEMEDAYEELDGSIIDKEKLMEDMEKTAQEIIDELEKQKESAKSEGEKEIKEKLISSLSE